MQKNRILGDRPGVRVKRRKHYNRILNKWVEIYKRGLGLNKVLECVVLKEDKKNLLEKCNLWFTGCSKFGFPLPNAGSFRLLRLQKGNI
jgi:hypothetical protein